MTQIATINKALSPTLSIAELQIVKCNTGLKVREIDERDLKNNLIDIISKAFFECRYSAPPAVDFKLMVDQLTKDVSNYFTTLTIEEIQLCFHNGCRKMYGDFAGLSNAVFHQWLQKFVSAPERHLALKKQRDFLTPPPKELTQQEKDAVAKECVMQLFEEFKKKGNVNDVGGRNYDYLDRMGVIPFNTERKKQIKEQAIAVLRKEASDKKANAKGLFSVREAMKELEEINSGKSSLIAFECKRIALNLFFKELMEMGEELVIDN